MWIGLSLGRDTNCSDSVGSGGSVRNVRNGEEVADRRYDTCIQDAIMTWQEDSDGQVGSPMLLCCYGAMLLCSTTWPWLLHT